KGALPALTGHAHWTWCAAYSPDGKTIASGGEEWNVVRLFDAATGKPGAVFKGPAGMVRGLAYSPDGKTLATAGNLNTSAGLRGGRVLLWDTTTGKSQQPFADAGAGFYHVAFSLDSKALAAAGFDGTVRLWGLADKKERFLLRAHSAALGVAFTPDGKR